MATKSWKGDALAVKQVSSWTFGGTWEADDIVNVTINGKVLSVTAGSTTLTTVVDNVVAAYNASTIAEFSEMTASRSGNDFRLTADTAGKPFTATLETTESGGGAADAQTIAAESVVTASSGPNHWDTAANWDTGTVPVNSDDVIVERGSDILYGLAQSAVTLASLTVKASYTGKIGLPQHNGQYSEYRNQYLAIGATTMNIGGGTGQGSGRIKINNGSVQTTCNVHSMSQPADQQLVQQAFIWKGTHASNEMNVNKGTVGIAILAGETATLANLRVGYVSNVQGDSVVHCGSGVTFGTKITQTGGQIHVASSVPTIEQFDGTTTTSGTGVNITTLTGNKGLFVLQSTGTITTFNGSKDHKFDATKDLRTGKTITNCDLFAGATFLDSNSVLTLTNGVDLNRCTIKDVTLDLGVNRRLTVGVAS